MSIEKTNLLNNFGFLYDTFHCPQQNLIKNSDLISLDGDGKIIKFEHDTISKSLDEELSRSSESETPEQFKDHIEKISILYENNNSPQINYIFSFYQVFFSWILSKYREFLIIC